MGKAKRGQPSAAKRGQPSAAMCRSAAPYFERAGAVHVLALAVEVKPQQLRQDRAQVAGRGLHAVGDAILEKAEGKGGGRG